MEDVTRQTLRVHSHEHARVRTNVAEYERDVLVLVDVVPVTEHAPYSHVGGEPCLGDSVHEPLGLQPVRDHLRNRDEGQAVLRGESLELRPTRARSVFTEDLADDAGRGKSGETG